MRVLRLNELPSYATEEDFAAVVAGHIAQWGMESYGFDRLIGDLYAELQPVLIPTFDGILVDSDGWLWARVYDWDRWSSPGTRTTASNLWIVFNSEGRALGTVDLSPGLEVHFIGTDLVLGVRRSDLGVEVVEGYRLTRGE